MTTTTPGQPFVVVLRGPSFARIPEGEQLVISGVPTTQGPANCVFRTYFVNEGYEALVPRGLWAEVQIAAPDIDYAIIGALNAANGIKTYLSAASNAYTGEMELELAFDATPGLTDHVYVQQFLPAPAGFPQPARTIPVAEAKAFLIAVGSHPRLDRLHRAVVHYESALRNWRRELAAVALTHLWIAAEALTPIARDRLLLDLGLPDETALAAQWRIEKKGLDPEVRKRIIFGGDIATYQAAKKVNDAYEHSFLDFQGVWQLALQAVEKAFAFTRASILDLAAVPTAERTKLLGQPYGRPFESVPMSRRVRGVVHAGVESMAPPDSSYPFLKWRSTVKEFKRGPDRRYQIVPEESFTPVLGAGGRFTFQRIEWWGPRLDPPNPAGPQELELEVVARNHAGDEKGGDSGT